MKGSKSCLILDSHDNERYKDISLLGVAAFDNDIKAFKMWLEAGCDLNYNGTSTLFFWLVNNQISSCILELI